MLQLTNFNKRNKRMLTKTFALNNLLNICKSHYKYGLKSTSSLTIRLYDACNETESHWTLQVLHNFHNAVRTLEFFLISSIGTYALVIIKGHEIKLNFRIRP